MYKKNRARRQRIFTYKTLRAGPISGAARMFPGAQRAPPAYFTHKKRSARIFTYKSASVFLRIKNAPRFFVKDLRLKSLRFKMRARSGRHLLVPGRPRECRQRVFTYKTLRASPISGAVGGAKSAPLSQGRKPAIFLSK